MVYGKPIPSNLTALQIEKNHTFVVPITSYAPTPFSYTVVNLNLFQVPRYERTILAVHQLRRPVYVGEYKPKTATLARTKEQHAEMHSYSTDKNGINGQVTKDPLEFPHSFYTAPIFEKWNDTDSDIVAVWITSLAWVRFCCCMDK